MEDIFGAWIQVVILVAYASIDFIVEEKHRKTRNFLKILLIASAIGSGFYQSRTLKADHQRAELDRHQAAEDRKQAAEDRKLSQAKIDKLTQDVKQITVDSQEKIQAEELKLTKAQSEAEIRAIQTEFTDFAENFPTNTHERAERLSKLKRDLKDAQADAERVAQETEKNARRDFNLQVYNPMNFALHCLQDPVRAYAVRTGEQIRIDTIELPDDLGAHPVKGDITFPSGAVWSLNIYSSGNQGAWFVVTFTDADHNQTGLLRAFVNLQQHNISLRYNATPPIPKPSTVNGEVPISDYETPLKRTYLRVIETQLIYAAKQ